VPDDYDSRGTADKLLDEAGVVCVPGNGFGKMGEGYVRFAATVERDRIETALVRMRELRW
jgi:aspartate/methionine/tyrosine aminotransferase